MKNLIIGLVVGALIGGLAFYPHSYITGDINHDGKVNSSDLTILLANFKQ